MSENGREQEMGEAPAGAALADILRGLPGVDRLLSLPVTRRLVDAYGHDLTVEALRATLDALRESLRTGERTVVPMNAEIVGQAESWLAGALAPSLQPVVNATGVIVHTNLGRAPLSRAALDAMTAVAEGYSTLEYDVAAGRRGSRTVHAATLLSHLTGAESALVVNNAASAVLLMLTALCQGGEVIISRGQLVEIGGGFRIPDVMAQSGARLVEVGTTNRTHLGDYADAITPETTAILVAHNSNYKVIGFTSQPTLAELAALAHESDLPLLYDQGSGLLLDTTPYGLEPEPTVHEALAAGCDVLAFSGDKLLGGPQAGILLGREALVGRLRRHPLARAVRADKLALAALGATLRPYLTGRATAEIPVWRMISRPLDEIGATAAAWAARLAEQGVAATVVDGVSTVGGGSLPGTSLATRLVAIDAPDVEVTAAALRASKPPVIGRIADGRLLLDPRTVLDDQVEALLAAVARCAAAADRPAPGNGRDKKATNP